MYKTLTKLAKSNRSGIPILSKIQVKDGVARSTDLDFWITVPSTLEDGVYHAESFEKNICLKSEATPDDFPEPVTSKGLQANTTIPFTHIAALEWVLKAASKDQARYYLNGIFCDWTEEQAKIVATDGHRIHNINHDIDATRPKKVRKEIPRMNAIRKKYEMVLSTTGAILQTVSVKLIIGLMKEFKTDAHITFYKTTFKANIGNALVEGKLVDGLFPDWRRCVPDITNMQSENFDPVQFIRILPELKAMAKIERQKKAAICIEKGLIKTNNNYECKPKEWPCIVNWDIAAGFNAAYISQACPGKIYYGAVSEPFVIIGWPGEVEKTTVLMPLRL